MLHGSPSVRTPRLLRNGATFGRVRLYVIAGKKNVNFERLCSFTPGLPIGDNSGIGIKACINGPVTIGADVMMGQEVIIYTTRHKDDRIDIPMRKQGMADVMPVVIGNDVWIVGIYYGD